VHKLDDMKKNQEMGVSVYASAGGYGDFCNGEKKDQGRGEGGCDW